MSYRIDYQGVKKVRGMEKRTVFVPAAVCLVGLLALALWPRGRMRCGRP